MVGPWSGYTPLFIKFPHKIERIMPTLCDLNEVMDKGLAHSEHSITGSQDESGLKLIADFRDLIEMLSTGAELVCAVDTPDHSRETDPWAILHIVAPVLLPE